MSEFLGPLDSTGRIPPPQQTRVAAFLISAHGALARRYAVGASTTLKEGWQTELHAQLYREMEMATLLMRATSWVPDFELPGLYLIWETIWLPEPIDGVADANRSLLIDLAALAHAIHAAIRPAASLPVGANAHDPFVLALRRIEFESSLLIQAQILFLKGSEFIPIRPSIDAAVESRHRQVRKLWESMLGSIGVGRA